MKRSQISLMTVTRVVLLALVGLAALPYPATPVAGQQDQVQSPGPPPYDTNTPTATHTSTTVPTYTPTATSPSPTETPLPTLTSTATNTPLPDCYEASYLPGPMIDPAEGWTYVDINTRYPGRAFEMPGTVFPAGRGVGLCGYGRDIWGRADSGGVLMRSLQTGLMSVEALMVALDPADPWTKTGVMVRSSLEPDAAHAFIQVTADYGLRFSYRSWDGALANMLPFQVERPEMAWLKLMQTGRYLRAYWSSDGQDWQPAGATMVPGLADLSWVGLAQSSHDEDEAAHSLFEQVAVSTPPEAFCTYQSGAFGVLALEAEHYNRLRPVASADSPTGEMTWQEVHGPPGYSGEGAMAAVPAGALEINTGETPDGPRLDYRLHFEQPGRYFVFVRGAAGAGPDPAANDSVLVGLDGQPVLEAGRGIYFNGSTDWRWGISRDGQPLVVQVDEPGLHFLNLWMRENGVLVDRLVLVHEELTEGRQFTLDEISAMWDGLSYSNPGWLPVCRKTITKK